MRSPTTSMHTFRISLGHTYYGMLARSMNCFTTPSARALVAEQMAITAPTSKADTNVERLIAIACGFIKPPFSL